MNIWGEMDIDLILAQLEQVVNALKCNICSKTYVEPIRVKVCGHYFCLECFKSKEPRSCPKCKTFYEEYEVDYDNIARETKSTVLDIKTYLLQSDAKELKCASKDNSETSLVEHGNGDEKNIFEYDTKRYHINYVDELYIKINAKGETPLHLACKRKALEEVERLSENVDVNAKDFAGWTPLHEATQGGSIQIVEVLLKQGALVNVRGESYVTPLHEAVMREDAQLIRLLLKYGADSKLIDYFGDKPVEYTRNERIKRVLSERFKCVQRVEEIFCRKKICAYYYNTEDSYKEKLNRSELVKVIKKFDAKKVTHFIMRRTHKPSFKILVAMLEGCFLVPQEWIDDFLKGQYFIPIPEYTFISNMQLNKGIRKALINSLLKLPKLFDGMSFFICGHPYPVEIHNITCSKALISSLIHAGGGKVLHRAPTVTSYKDVLNFPYHSNKSFQESRCCHYIIYEEKNPPTVQYEMAEIKHKSSKWLLDCIINFTV